MAQQAELSTQNSSVMPSLAKLLPADERTTKTLRFPAAYLAGVC